MSQVDIPILERVVSECPEIESAAFENVIFRINSAYSAAKLKSDTVDFELIRDKVLEYCDLFNLLEHKIYKSAVGKYYGLRRGQEQKDGYEAGTVYEVSPDHVLIAADKDVKILFRTFKREGKLSFTDVDTGKERFHRKGGSTFVDEKKYHQAKQQALAIMNSRRTF